MADAIVSALVQSVVENLGSVALRQIGASWGLKDELDKLGSLFGTIQAVLEDADVKRRNNKPLQIWLLKLKDAAYDADDILDQVATQGLNRGVNSERGKIHELSAFFSKRNTLLFKSRIVVKVKEITARLDAIANEKHNFHLMEGMIMNNRMSDTLQDRQTSSLVNESEIYGRNEERDFIVEKLVGGGICDQEDLTVFAVCGMGGIGKTTLAQLVYNDRRVVEGHFDVRIWVCVSDDFSIQRLIRAIIESIGGNRCDASELDPLQRHLQGKLRGRRYLLILDDVWNENPNLWDRLRETLRCGSKGSVVMVTTRSEKVATMMAAINIHRLQYLSEEHSWLLFKRRAFANGEGGGKEFEEIGKEIVTKCGGVPLAVKAVGSLMRYKSSQSEWLAIQKSAIWTLSGDENDILPVLRLSYDNLPLQMRQCFSYCCIFPKDYKMHTDLLVQLWMANGFVSSDNEAGSYLTGCSIFKELVWRSFFQDAEKDYEGIMYCKMHDLMHDLAKSVMIHETHVLEHGKEIKIPKTVRHLFFENISDGLPLYRNKGKLKWRNDKSLRSLIAHTDTYLSTADGFSFFLSKQQYLRVLRTRTCVNKLANIVCKLEQLRYLEMSCRDLKTLPESLIRLQNLQTLKLVDSWRLVELPKGLKYLKNLCFVKVKSSFSLVCTPPELRELTCLQELSIFIVGEHGAHKIDQLKDLNLGGELSIRGLEYIENYDDAKSANLQTKINITCLKLDWRNEIKQHHVEHYEGVLEGLQPNQNLEKICIQWYQGSKFPKWMSTSYFKNLSEITLKKCSECERLPALGKLPSLKRLNLYRMKAIKCLDVEWHGDGDSSFPALTSLSVEGMDNLVEWTTPDSVESFPSLTDLNIFECPKLIALPFLPNLKRLSLSFGKNRTLLGSIMGLTSITYMNLSNISELDVLPQGLLQNHNALKSLTIQYASIKTLSNELDNLSALQNLCLHHCFNLEVLPEGLKHLISLDSHTSRLIWPFLGKLTISDCKKLEKIEPLPITPNLQVSWW